MARDATGSMCDLIGRCFQIKWPFKTQRDKVARRGSQRELMDNQLIVSAQSEHGPGSVRQESTHTQTGSRYRLDYSKSLCFKQSHMTVLCGFTQGKSTGTLK